MVLRHSLIVGVAALVAACASQTPYQPAKKGRNGYESTFIEDDRARVAFHGNSSTPRTAVETALLYRAAEVTKERGGDYFVVNIQDIERTTDLRTTSTGFGAGFGFGAARFGHFRRGVLFGPGFVGPGFGGVATTREIPRYSAVAEILIRSGEKPGDDPNAYDAQEVLEHVGPSLVRPESG